MIILHFDLQPQFKYMIYFIYTSHQEKVSRFYYFPPYFELFRRIDVFPIQTLITTSLRNVMLTVTRELGLPAVLETGFAKPLKDFLID